jgi:hypothetical protein
LKKKEVNNAVTRDIGSLRCLDQKLRKENKIGYLFSKIFKIIRRLENGITKIY